MPHPDFTAHVTGVCHAHVCSSLPPESVEERMNIANPTANGPPWRLAAGGPPADCLVNAETHKHYLLVRKGD